MTYSATIIVVGPEPEEPRKMEAHLDVRARDIAEAIQRLLPSLETAAIPLEPGDVLCITLSQEEDSHNYKVPDWWQDANEKRKAANTSPSGGDTGDHN